MPNARISWRRRGPLRARAMMLVGWSSESRRAASRRRGPYRIRPISSFRSSRLPASEVRFFAITVSSTPIKSWGQLRIVKLCAARCRLQPRPPNSRPTSSDELTPPHSGANRPPVCRTPLEACAELRRSVAQSLPFVATTSWREATLEDCGTGRVVGVGVFPVPQLTRDRHQPQAIAET
jgi:hypothetical protein